MSARNPCPECGKPITTGLLGGACPECMASSMLQDWDQLSSPSAISLEPVITRVADYDVLRVIGRGGMGVVCRARDRLLGREVALKLIHSGVLASDEELRRFRLEAEAVARLRHENLIVIHEAGEADGQPYFTMTLAEGGTLAARLRTLGRLEPREAVQMMESIAQGVHHAHTRGVLHRDLKPANIVFDLENRPLVSDFGLARFTGADSVTNSGTLLGTPAYLAPEVASGAAGHTTGSDVYALGIILYECLAGQPPFENESPLALLKMITERSPAPLSASVPGIDRDLEAVCWKALEKEPHRRYASAEAMAQDLSRWLRHEPVDARHPPVSERFWRWAQHNQARAVLYSMAVVTVLIMIALSGLMNVVLSTEQVSTAAAMRQSETRRAAVLRDHAAHFMADEATLLRALPFLEEAAELGTSDAAQDHAIRLRQRVVTRLAPRMVHRWAIQDLQPVLAWSPDSRVAAISDSNSEQAFNVQVNQTAEATGPSLKTTRPQNPMQVPDDGHLPLRSLHSPDGQHVLVHSRDAVTLWSRARMPVRWQGQGLKHAWFDARGRLLLKTDAQTLQVQANAATEVLAEVEAPPPQTATPPALCSVRDLLAVADGRLVRLWRGKVGEREIVEPLPHPAPVIAAAFDAGGLYLATVAKDEQLRVWEAATGLPITPPIPVGKNTRLTWDGTRQMIAAWSETEVLWFDW